MDNNTPPDLKDIFGKSKLNLIAIPIVIILVLTWLSFYTVSPGKRGVLVRLGAVQSGVIAPGAHFKLPFLDRVEEVNVRVQKFHAKETAASKDLQIVTTTVAINFHLEPTHVDELFKSVGQSRAVEAKVLTPATANAIKAVTARYDAEDLISKRDAVRAGIEDEIRQALKRYNVTIDAVNITDFAFSKDYASAIENKQVAQQRALQAKYELQKTKIDAQQQVVQAEAKAKATVAAAQAEAKALKLKRQEVTPELIMLNAVQKWDGQLPKVYTGGEKGMMNLLNLDPSLSK